MASVGIDTEPVVTSKTRKLVEAEIASPHEWHIVNAMEFSSELAFSLVFSAKEAFYKCWYPITGNFFGFQDAVVEAVTANSIRIGHAASNPNVGRGPDALEVRYWTDGDDVFTITWIEPEAIQ